jgi:hypothetical protein
MRRWWRSSIGLVVVAAVAGAAVLAALAGARRTASAYDRFTDHQHAFDAALVHDGSFPEVPPDVDAIAALPDVAESMRYFHMYANVGPGQGMIIPEDGRLFTSFNRARVLQGRPPDPERFHEITVAFPVAEAYGLEPGSRIPSVPEEFADFVPPEAIFDLVVVGIHAAPGQFPPLSPGDPGVIGSPAYYRLMASGQDPGRAPGEEPSPRSIAVRLRGGASAVPAFREATADMGGFFYSQDEAASRTRRSIDMLANALRIVAAVGALVLLLVLSQLVARVALLEAGDQPTLAALGMTTRQLVSAGVLRFVPVGVAAGALAAAGATAASPLTPIGLARTAEPDGGVHVDAAVIGGGALVLAVSVVLCAVPVLIRRARPRRREEVRASRSILARTAIGMRRPSIAAGLHLATDPGRGRARVPVASTVIVAGTSLAAVAASLGFGASLTDLLDSPKHYGFTWDATYTTYGEADLSDGGDELLSAEPSIERYTLGAAGDAEIGDESVGVLAMRTADGVAPPILKGRLPRGDGEVALGVRTSRRVGAGIGDTVAMSDDDEPVDLTVVGIAVIPFTNSSQLGDGALMDIPAARAIDDSAPLSDVFIRFASSASRSERAETLERLEDAFAERFRSPVPGVEGEVAAPFVALPHERPSDVVNFGRIDGLPLALSATLLAVAAATLVHVLLTSVRRRRRELAILKVLGFRGRDLASAVAWHATVLVVAAAAIGLPVGVAAGRVLWSRFAEQTGVIASPVVPLAQLALVAGGVVVLANLISTVPARIASRVPAAVSLRTE